MMPRALSAGFAEDLAAETSGDIHLFFLTISHPALGDPIRVVSDVVDYIRDGQRWTGCPFSLDLPTDDERAPRAKIGLQNVDRRIGAALLDPALGTSPELMIELLSSADFAEPALIDGIMTRAEAVTPSVEYAAPALRLRNTSGDVGSISADIGSYDLTGQPWPRIRTTADRCPGVYL